VGILVMGEKGRVWSTIDYFILAPDRASQAGPVSVSRVDHVIPEKKIKTVVFKDTVIPTQSLAPVAAEPVFAEPVEGPVASGSGSESDVDPPTEMDELRAAAKYFYYQDVNEPNSAVPAGTVTPVEILDSHTRSGNPFQPSRDLPRDAQFAFAFNALLEYERLPSTYAEAKSSPDWKNWKEAIVRELTAFRDNNTWITIKNYLGARKLPYKWVLTRKYEEHGDPTVYKARLVIGGHKQVAGVDYDEIYASVARTQTIRVFLAYATILDWSVYQMDYDTAFLNGDIDTRIHMQPLVWI
jgi:hypothetical protein